MGDIYEDTVAIYESPTARSDHDSFQNIGVATLGWNGLVDGYPCYHRTCDTMETMIDYMGTDNSTGINNLVHSWDIVYLVGLYMRSYTWIRLLCLMNCELILNH